MKIPISNNLFEHLITTWAGEDSQDVDIQVIEKELQELIDLINFVG